ncbi:hypothetical protein STEG23_015404 [Scotinomys teguina]
MMRCETLRDMEKPRSQKPRHSVTTPAAVKCQDIGVPDFKRCSGQKQVSVSPYHITIKMGHHHPADRNIWNFPEQATALPPFSSDIKPLEKSRRNGLDKCPAEISNSTPVLSPNPTLSEKPLRVQFLIADVGGSS